MLEDRQLSQMFLRKGLIDDATLQKATKLSASRGTSLYDTLLSERMIDEEKAIVAVSKQLNLPCVSLKEFEANPKILALVAHDLAERFSLMPLGLTEEDGERKLFVAMANPLDIDAIDQVSKASGFPVVQLLAGPTDVREAIKRSYAAAETADVGSSLDVGSMLDGLFDDAEPSSEATRDATPARAEPAATVKSSDSGLGGGFSLDFGDLGLAVGGDKPLTASTRREDVHNRMTLPAGTELPRDAAAAFKRAPTTVSPVDARVSVKPEDEDEAELSVLDDDDGVGGPMDDWSDLATFGIEEDDDDSGSSRMSSQAPPTRTENSTVRYVADPSLQRAADKDGFPHNIPSSDLIRATVSLLVQKGILTEKQIKEEIKRIRHGQRRRR